MGRGRRRQAERPAAHLLHQVATEAGHVTGNVVLWPRMFVLALSKKRFDALTTQQQAWVRGAAEQAVKNLLNRSESESRIRL